MIKHIIKIEIAGFIFLAAVQWIIEIFDIPSILAGKEATPINYGESVIESIVILLVGIFVVTSTRMIINRIKLLEGMLPICASCKKIRVDSKWITIEEYLYRNSDLQLTHSICPACAEKLYDYKQD